MTGIAGYQCAASGRAAEKRDELLPPHKHCPQAEDYTLAYRWARALLCITAKWTTFVGDGVKCNHIK
jgi:hypothetical protein